MIYFVQRANGDIKIGTTIDYQLRRGTLKKKYGSLKLLGWLDGGVDEERRFHKQFKEYQLPGNRSEWFSPKRELVQFIKHHTHKGNPPLESRSLRITPEIADWIELLLEKAEFDGQPTTTSEILRSLLITAHPNIESISAELKRDKMINHRRWSRRFRSFTSK